MTINGKKLTAEDILRLALQPKQKPKRRKRLRSYCASINLNP